MRSVPCMDVMCFLSNAEWDCSITGAFVWKDATFDDFIDHVSDDRPHEVMEHDIDDDPNVRDVCVCVCLYVFAFSVPSSRHQSITCACLTPSG